MCLINHYFLSVARFVICLCAFACKGIAFATLALAQSDQVEESNLPVIPIGSEYENSIQFLNNRFRIDGDIEALTLLFFRERGSAPIVLVKPDGSKYSLSIGRDTPGLDWYETETYDLIRIRKPMPGPWQAVGQLLPNSKVMAITKISLDAQPIPSPVYSGEVIKQTATLLNDGKPVNLIELNEVVTLDIDFVSNNNPNYENFGLGTRRVAQFEDNGAGYDEYASDGIFTGQFDLKIPPGEWRPIFSINTPLFSREQINDVIILLPNPIIVRAKIDPSGEGDHIVSVDVDRSQILMGSLIFEGTIRFPNGEVDNLSYTNTSEEIKTVRVINSEFGTYRFKITAYAKTVQGRDIILDVPEFTFTSVEPIVPEEVASVSDTTIEEIKPEIVEEELSTFDLIIWILAINFTILIIGGIVLFVVSDIQRHPDNHVLMKLRNSVNKVIDSIKKNRKKDQATDDDEIKLS